MPTDGVSQDPIYAISVLLAALGLSATSGFRAYLPLLALAIGSDTTSNTLFPLRPEFRDALGNPLLIGLLVVLTLGEFVVDKIPIVDHVSDAFHTLIRPLSGAIIMAGTINPISNINIWLAAGVGAALALATHGVKAGARPAVSATTAGIGNPIVSVVEDVVALIAVIALLISHIIGAIAGVVIVLLIAYLFWRIVRFFSRRLRGGGGRRGRGSQPPAATPEPTFRPLPAPTSAPPASQPGYHTPGYQSNTTGQPEWAAPTYTPLPSVDTLPPTRTMSGQPGQANQPGYPTATYPGDTVTAPMNYPNYPPTSQYPPQP